MYAFRFSYNIVPAGPLVGSIAGISAVGVWIATNPKNENISLTDRFLADFEKFNDWSRDVC